MVYRTRGGAQFWALPDKADAYIQGSDQFHSDYIRADIADELLAALKLAARELTADGERERGPTIRAVIARAEGKE